MSVSPSVPSEVVDGLARQIEAVLFVAPDGVSIGELSRATGASTVTVRRTLKKLVDELPAAHGLEVCNLGGQWYLTTASDLSDVVEAYRSVDDSTRVRLSKAALETLAVVAYGQPVTRSEIDEIRGVRSDRALETLLGHGLVRIAGRRKSTGSPLLYRTAERFLKIFGLGSIADLPTVAEIDELRRGVETSLDDGEEMNDRAIE